MTPFTGRSGRFSPLKTVTLAGLAAPALWLCYRAAIHDLGPLALKEAQLFLGLWAIRLLILTLALTPAQRLFNLPRLALIRRMAGVSAFAYAFGHLTLYVAMQKFNLLFAAAEIAQRHYLTIGFMALLGLAALAATSTDAMLRRLGRRWKRLHRLVYGIAALAVLHFMMQSKIDVSEAVMMAGLLAMLMIYRGLILLRLQLSAVALLLTAGLGALATAGLEVAWYGLATGVDPWRVAAANVTLAHGLRPAAAILLAGLAVAASALAWRNGWAMRPAARRLTPA